MNLELLDPFGRQVPDRVDATIQLPDILHYPPSHQTQQQQHQQQSFTNSSTYPSKKLNLSKEKRNDDDEEEEDEGDDEEDHEMEEDDLEESNKAKRRSTTKPTKQKSSKNRRRAAPDKDHANNNNNANSKVDASFKCKDKNDIVDNDEWKAAYHVSYNRRGNYLAVGYGSGTVAVFCTLSRTLTALYYADDKNSSSKATDISNYHNTSSNNPLFQNNTKLKSSGTNATSKSKNNKSTTTSSHSNNISTGCSNLSWARRSRRLLIGNYNDARVKIIDTTHPIGAEDCACAAATIVSLGQTATAVSNNTSNDPNDVDNDSTTGDVKELKTKPSKESIQPMSRHTTISSSFSNDIIPPVYPYRKTMTTPFAGNEKNKKYTFARKALSLSTEVVQSRDVPAVVSKKSTKKSNSERSDNERVNANTSATNQNVSRKTTIRYPYVAFSFEHPVVGSLHIHPRFPNSGIAVLADGSLVFFCIPFHSKAPFVNKIHIEKTETDHEVSAISIDDGGTRNVRPVNIHPLYTKSNVSCAAFDSLGKRIYAVTKLGTILGFDIAKFWTVQIRSCRKNDGHLQHPIPLLEPTVVIPRHYGNKGGETASSTSSLTSIWHLVVSRNGKFLIVNSSDGTIRLYDTMECWSATAKAKNDVESIDTNPIIKPTWIFQDVVTKVKFASCDLSGDGEYVVGGANGADNKYELHIWNTSTGALMDKLTGASTKLYSVAWHPTRSFLAVACSDGLVDVWGPRINWTAFAPDFQALPMNVEYIEREDEFDLDENGRHLAEGYYAPNEMSESLDTNTPINVTKIERVPVFASDSEEEEEVFAFEVRVKNLFAGRVVEVKSSNRKGVMDD